MPSLRSLNGGRRGANEGAEDLNPYIALSDLVISVILIVVFFVALGQLGLANLKYQRAMDDFAEQVAQRLPPEERPLWEQGRNDPPGVQRWVFSGHALFLPAASRRSLTDPVAPPKLTAGGAEALTQFARLLKEDQAQWRRVRVEGHTQPPNDDEMDDWELSSARAAVVARQIQIGGKIPSWFLGVAGRAGQNHLYKVIVYVRAGDAASASVISHLQAAGVTFSRRDITHDQTARNDWNQRHLTTIPAIRLQDSDEQEITVPAGDTTAFRDLVSKWAENDRVEILVEYSKNSPGSDTSH